MPVHTPTLGPALPPVLRALVERHQERRAKTTADKSLARRLMAAVRAADVPVSGIALYVHDGAVSIYGTVADGAEREALLGVASAQPGVRRIVDHLHVGGH